MARPLRIEFPDAWYHVMNRGRRGDLIFKDKGDYYAFIDLLKDCIEMWNIRVVAYCLMGTLIISFCKLLMRIYQGV